jgi:hypothetical protein
MSSTYGIAVDLFPVLNNDQAYRDSFAPISIGLGNWGSRNPMWNPPNVSYATSPIGRATAVHNLGKLWMQPVSVQDSRMHEGIYDEANNTQNLRDTWALARASRADWVLLPTWNDYTENSHIAPSALHGYAFVDLMAYYITWFKTGTAPSIVRDGVYLTHRRQPYAATPSYPQSILQKWRGGTPPRDTVESLSFLTSPATVSINVGGVVTSCSSPAGVSTCLAPLRAGSVSVTVTRSGTAVTSVTSPAPVSAKPYVQDLEYVAASSLRTGSNAAPDANPVPAPNPPTAAPAPVAASAPTVTTAAAVRGAARVGTVATCAGAVSGGSAAYAWTLNGVKVSGASRSRLALPAKFLGKKLGCRIVVKNAKGSATTIARVRKVTAGVAPRATVKPSLRSAPKVRRTAYVRAGTWTARPAYFRYVYVVNGRVVALMSRNYIRISPSWRGKTFVVVVRAFAAGRLMGAAATPKVVIR